MSDTIRVPALNEGRPFRAGNPPPTSRATSSTPTSLNEGRPFRAGNPGAIPRTAGVHVDAQRRPALPGRQPPVREQRGAHAGRRSTKAGPSGPATRDGGAIGGVMVSGALNEGRPFRAGNPTADLVGSQHRLNALNEGRPFRAGNPMANRPVILSAATAQRRPALPGRQPLPTSPPTSGTSAPLNEGRPFRAGNPLHSRGGACRRRRPLNEGRPFRAGNPSLAA